MSAIRQHSNLACSRSASNRTPATCDPDRRRVRHRAHLASQPRIVSLSAATAGAVFPETHPFTSPEDRATFSPRLGGPSGGHGSLGSLATYDLPKPRQKQRWLDETIRKAVLNIGEAPFLQATSTDPHPQLRRFHVAPAIGSAPQLWTSIVRHITGQETDSVLFVSPLSLGDNENSAPTGISCMFADACSSAREILSGVVTGESPAIVSGRVGECCDGAHPHSHAGHEQGPDVFKHSYAKASQILPYVPLRRGMAPEPTVATSLDRPSEGRMRAGSMTRGQLQELYGVVIQAQDLKGCFLLKTLKHEEADCQCTSYSLAKVCDGMPT